MYILIVIILILSIFIKTEVDYIRRVKNLKEEFRRESKRIDDIEKDLINKK